MNGADETGRGGGRGVKIRRFLWGVGRIKNHGSSVGSGEIPLALLQDFALLLEVFQNKFQWR